MYYQKTTAELLARAIKVCDRICEYANPYHCYGNRLTEIVGLAKSCKEVLEILQSVVENNSKDDPVVSSVEKRIAKSEDDIRELKKRLKEYKNYSQKWPLWLVFSVFRRKELPNLKPSLQSLRENLGGAKKVTTITIEKCEQRTVKTILHDEADDEPECPPPRYTRYEEKPTTTYSTKSTSTENLDTNFMAAEPRGPAPVYRSLNKTANGAHLHLSEVDMPYEDDSTITANPYDLACQPLFYQQRLLAVPTGIFIAMIYKPIAASEVPECVLFARDVNSGLYLKNTCIGTQ